VTLRSRLALAVTVVLLPFALPSTAHARVQNGLDVLENAGFKLLQGRKVAVITNQTGRTADGRSIVDVLHRAKGVTLTAILSPEHGFRGDAEHGAKIADEVDAETHLPIYSLYGETTRPTDKMLAGADTIVFDMQDIGTRYYTYITTMGQALEEAAARKMKFVVLDRPNPIRGDILEGDILDSDIKRMTGYFQIPVRHGFTVGELATWMNETRRMGADLTVVKLKNWKRSMWFNETGLDFVPPSPNIPRVITALLYSGIGGFEATNVAVGRGTDLPFEVIGAPWMNAKALTSYLRGRNFPGLLFEETQFTPTKDLYAGQVCQGVRIIVTDRNAASPFEVFVTAFLYLSQNQADAFKPEWEEVRVVTGSNRLKEAAAGGWRLEDLIAYYRDRAAEFAKSAAPFRLY
jgi:uncharacterized protein YbbC (DUF1343 family)